MCYGKFRKEDDDAIAFPEPVTYMDFLHYFVSFREHSNTEKKKKMFRWLRDLEENDQISVSTKFNIIENADKCFETYVFIPGQYYHITVYNEFPEMIFRWKQSMISKINLEYQRKEDITKQVIDILGEGHLFNKLDISEAPYHSELSPETTILNLEIAKTEFSRNLHSALCVLQSFIRY